MNDMARLLRYALDVVAFGREVLNFEPDPWQEEFLRSSGDVLLNCCRQSGKSTCMAILALHTIIFWPGAPVLIIAASKDQANETYRKVEDFRKLVDFLPTITEDNTRNFALANGSRLIVAPENEATVRGVSAVRLLIEDEASRIPDLTDAALSPMLAVSKGRRIKASTPNGRQGHFYEAWQDEEGGWTRFKVTADDCPRIASEHIAQERRRIGDALVDQEYYGEFIEAIGQLFRQSDIDAMFTDEVEPWELGHAPA